jgi:hypothetical protein
MSCVFSENTLKEGVNFFGFGTSVGIVQDIHVSIHVNVLINCVLKQEFRGTEILEALFLIGIISGILVDRVALDEVRLFLAGGGIEGCGRDVFLTEVKFVGHPDSHILVLRRTGIATSNIGLHWSLQVSFAVENELAVVHVAGWAEAVLRDLVHVFHVKFTNLFLSLLFVPEVGRSETFLLWKFEGSGWGDLTSNVTRLSTVLD